MRVTGNRSVARESTDDDFFWVKPYKWRVFRAVIGKGARAQRYGQNNAFSLPSSINMRINIDEDPQSFNYLVSLRERLMYSLPDAAQRGGVKVLDLPSRSAAVFQDS